MQNIIQAFTEAMQSHGINPALDIVADDKWHNSHAVGEKPSKKIIYYRLKIDGDFAVGNYGSYREGVTHTFTTKAAKEYSKEEKEAWATRQASEKAERETERKETEMQAAVTAKTHWAEAELPIDTHPYLKRKGIEIEGLRVEGDKLLIPMFGINGKISSLQTIDEQGEKLYLKGGRKQGCFYPFPATSHDTILICEGISTAASVHAAVPDYAVFAAFDAGNLLSVAEALRGKYPEARIWLLCDNDAFKDKNTGIDKGKIAAAKVNGFAIWPEFVNNEDTKCTDYCDLHQSAGIAVVRSQILERIERSLIAQGDVPAEVSFEPLADVGVQASAGDYEEEEQQEVGGDLGLPFRVLGYNQETYYYFPFEKRQIFALAGASHTLNNLLQLASTNQWQRSFGGGHTEISATQIPAIAANALFRIAHKRGVFTEENKVRGCGAWMDAGRKMLHCGNEIYVDGVPTDTKDVLGNYVYIAAPRLLRPSLTPLRSKEAIKLRKICEMPTWETKLSGSLLAGWLVIAPVCSILPWRPHLWITGEADSGKAQPHSALVLTPSGFRRMGDLAVGDTVTTPDNSFAKILGVFPQGRQVVYKITFSDGRTAYATTDHLWKVRVANEWRIRTTGQIIDVLNRGTRASASLAIPLTAAVDMERNNKQKLPLHPYVLGAMIGDGHFANENSGTTGFTCFDPEIVERIKTLLPDYMGIFEKRTAPNQFRFGDLSRYGRRTRALIKELGMLGRKSHDKYIPKDYLCASVSARMEMLRGLMDTDGYVGEGGSLSYCTVSKRLCDDVVFLVRSLGGIAKASKKHAHYTYKGERKQGRLAYNINIRMKDRQDSLYLNIKKIEIDGEDDCRCILIDHPDRLYVTDNFVVTHNSTILDRIIKPTLGAIALNVDGGTTEPGIRMLMGYDGRPIIYDEAESETPNQRSTMEGVLQLARKASSGATVGKFGQKPFKAQFCICFSAINPGITAFADESRYSMLTLKKNRKRAAQEDYDALLDEIATTITPEFQAGLLARTVASMPTLLKNIEVFRRGARKVLNVPRLADQLAPMLAGLYLLGSDKVIADAKAEEWIAAQDWTMNTAVAAEPEYLRLMRHISTSIIRAGHVKEALSDYTVGELISAIHKYNDRINTDFADRTLRMYSIAVKDGFVDIGNRNHNLGRLLKNTQWEMNWHRTLSSLPDSGQKSSVYFSAGDKQNATRIPAKYFINDEYDNLI